MIKHVKRLLQTSLLIRPKNLFLKNLQKIPKNTVILSEKHYFGNQNDKSFKENLKNKNLEGFEGVIKTINNFQKKEYPEGKSEKLLYN
jgi:hypothetical protein